MIFSIRSWSSRSSRTTSILSLRCRSRSILTGSPSGSVPTTLYPLSRRNSERYDPSWPPTPVMSAVGIAFSERQDQHAGGDGDLVQDLGDVFQLLHEARPDQLLGHQDRVARLHPGAHQPPLAEGEEAGVRRLPRHHGAVRPEQENMVPLRGFLS